MLLSLRSGTTLPWSEGKSALECLQIKRDTDMELLAAKLECPQVHCQSHVTIAVAASAAVVGIIVKLIRVTVTACHCLYLLLFEFVCIRENCCALYYHALHQVQNLINILFLL